MLFKCTQIIPSSTASLRCQVGTAKKTNHPTVSWGHRNIHSPPMSTESEALSPDIFQLTSKATVLLPAKQRYIHIETVHTD